MKFTDDQKQVNEFNDKYFSFGVHRVIIGSVELGHTEAGKEYIEIMVMDPEDNEVSDLVRVWFTTDAAINFSFNILRQIFIHNCPEDKKDEARELFGKISDTETLAETLQGLAGKECWYTKYYSPDQTYVAKDGKVKKSVNKNIYGYKPKLKPELMPAPNTGPVDLGALGVGQEVPFESPGDAAGSHVPADDAWSGK